MLNKSIGNALKKISLMWPLHQAVAVNPLEDLMDLPLSDASWEITKRTGELLTQPIEYYYEQFDCSEISSLALNSAIVECIKLPDGISTQDLTIIKQIVFSFLTSDECRALCQEQQKSLQEYQRKVNQALVSQQISEFVYDNAYDTSLGLMLDLLANFHNSQSDADFMQFCKTFLVTKHKFWQHIFDDLQSNTEIFNKIEEVLHQLTIPSSQFETYCFHIFWSIKGWIGLIKWQHSHPHNPWLNKNIQPEQIVLIWLCCELFYLKTYANRLKDFKYNPISHFDDDVTLKQWTSYYNNALSELSPVSNNDLKSDFDKLELSYKDIIWIWQTASEYKYQNSLLSVVNQSKSLDIKSAIDSQWVFCIDTRSEGVRRYLEKNMSCQTFGFAGFFGFALKVLDNSANYIRYHCPALLDPQTLIEQELLFKTLLSEFKITYMQIIKDSKNSNFSAFVLFEMLGSWFSFWLVAKNYLNKPLSLLNFQKRNLLIDETQLLEKLGLENAVNAALFLLKGVTLTANFSSVIVICGHAAQTENNPFQAMLDCGACGGNSGFFNAIIACLVLNNSKIREKLFEANIDVPKSTCFIPACHNTTTNTIVWGDNFITTTAEQSNKLSQLKKQSKLAMKQLLRERQFLDPRDSDFLARASHWAELVPEWGLANNAAMIIGPRELSQKHDLKQRVFLHSYLPELDKDGTVLETILTAPMIVAFWINMQYYCSSIAPAIYGSGNKAIHNVIPNIGVMEGNQSDLKFGLPDQSLFFETITMHEPRRLYVIIYASEDIVQKIIKKHAMLKQLVEGRWLKIKVLEPS